MENYYYTVTTVLKDPKHPYRTVSFAEQLCVVDCVNLAYEFKDYAIVNPCPTLARAKEIADDWNESYKMNGKYPKNEDWRDLLHWKKLTLDELNELRRLEALDTPTA